jgi:L-alanine-DL-glutamate epimerase-like enolase superfamily enzyme
MKITNVRSIIIKMPFTKAGLTGSVPSPSLMLIVEVSTDGGINGIGQSFTTLSSNSAATLANCLETMIKPKVAGKDPLAITGLWNELYYAFYSAGRSGITIAALSGFEIALWDIKGKALRAPVYQLLGGAAHDRIRAFASLSQFNTPAEAAQAATYAAKQGFTALKLHLGDVETLAAVRKAVGDNFDVMVDLTANCRWDPSAAVKKGLEFAAYNPYWFEQPVFPHDDYDGLAFVRSKLNIPLATGEDEYTANGFKPLIEKRAVDYLQPSIVKIGGLLQEKKVFTLADTFNLKVAPNCWSTGPALAATLHVCFSEPNAFIIETPIDLPEAPILIQPFATLDKGYWQLPVSPGLGIEFNEKALAKYIIK